MDSCETSGAGRLCRFTGRFGLFALLGVACSDGESNVGPTEYILTTSGAVDWWVSRDGESVVLTTTELERVEGPVGALTPEAEALLVEQCNVLTEAAIDEERERGCTGTGPYAGVVLEACDGRRAGWCFLDQGLAEEFEQVDSFANDLFDQMATCEAGTWFAPGPDCDPFY